MFHNIHNLKITSLHTGEVATDSINQRRRQMYKEMASIIDAAGLTNVKGFDGENKTKWRRRSEARATSTLASGFVTT